MTLLQELKANQIEYFKIKPIMSTKYKKLKIECIYTLLFIIYFLEDRGFTLSHICLSDFEVYEQYLFLKHDDHVVELMNDSYLYEDKSKKEALEFLPPTNTKNHKSHLYRSVGQFIFWVLTHSNTEITEEKLEPFYYTKPYFFIKNTMGAEPSLIYL
jgi:hypothetical protein